MSNSAIKLLFINAPTDQLILQNLKDHLYLPIKNGTVEVLEIEDGRENSRILSNQDSSWKWADLVLPLVSHSLLENYSSIEEELQSVSNLVPILVSPCEWPDKILNPKAVLPDNRLPVSSWELKDEALLSVVKGILEIAATIEPKTEKPAITSTTLSALEREGLVQQQTILIEKLSYLRKNFATMSEGAKKFELMKDIEQLEKDVKEIQQKLGS